MINEDVMNTIKKLFNMISEWIKEIVEKIKHSFEEIIEEIKFSEVRNVKCSKIDYKHFKRKLNIYYKQPVLKITYHARSNC